MERRSGNNALHLFVAQLSVKHDSSKHDTKTPTSLQSNSIDMIYRIITLDEEGAGYYRSESGRRECAARANLCREWDERREVVGEFVKVSKPEQRREEAMRVKDKMEVSLFVDTSKTNKKRM